MLVIFGVLANKNGFFFFLGVIANKDVKAKNQKEKENVNR